MGKYTGSGIKKLRALGMLPGLTAKNPDNRRQTPGEHGVLRLPKMYNYISENFKESLIQKQRIRYNFGIREKQLHNYYKIFKKKKELKNGPFLILLEHRLDCLLYRIGFALSIPAARQIINHGHVFVNNKKVNIPSFLCNLFDIITFSENIKIQSLIEKNFSLYEIKREMFRDRRKSMLALLNSFDLTNDEIGQTLFSKLSITKLKTDLPSYIEIDNCPWKAQLISKIEEDDIHLYVDERKVIEYYSN